MTKPKTKSERQVRQPRPKAFQDNPLQGRGLPKPHPIVDLFQTQVDGQDLQSGGRPNETVDGKPSTTFNVFDGKPSTIETSGRPEVQTSGRPKVDKHRWPKETIRLNPSIVKKINILCAKLEIRKQDLWEILAVHLIDLVDGKPSTALQKLVDGNPAHDDMMIFSTHEDIIMRYQTYTLQKWTLRDDRDGKRYNEVDFRLIDIAFISTIEKKLRGNTAKQPIKSFNYFTQEIDLLLNQHQSGELPAALDEYHKYVLSTWEKRIRKVRDEKWAEKFHR
ncbi:MAG: hypothetical protein K1Y36_27375 [Blastocatellia bacterium]|nr:hypothetical protein [Blastocatellia bacterium]